VLPTRCLLVLYNLLITDGRADSTPWVVVTKLQKRVIQKFPHQNSRVCGEKEIAMSAIYNNRAV